MSGTQVLPHSREFSVSVYINGIHYKTLHEFFFINELNEIPRGEFVIVNSASDLVDNKTAMYGVIHFEHVGDDLKDKKSSLPIIIDSLKSEYNSPSTLFRYKWTAGSPEMNKRTTEAKQTSSVKALSYILQKYNQKVNNKLENSSQKTVDDMCWRWVQEDLWEKLNTVTTYSFIANDYVFWCWDDVNSNFKISTLTTESNTKLRYIFTYSESSGGSTGSNGIYSENPLNTTYSFGKFSGLNVLGQNKNHLFPNVNFQSYISNDLGDVAFSGSNFGEWLVEIGDKKLNDVKKSTNLNDPNYTFGDLKIRRHYNNNTHKHYSISDIYRNYKIATYAKVLFVTLTNIMGPPLGSSVTVIVPDATQKATGNDRDLFFSDKYIIAQKTITYSSVSMDSTGKQISSQPTLVVILKLISENFDRNGNEAIKELETNARLKLGK